MRIENDIKLDYKDVLIRPKRSTLKSRAQVDITREFKFRNSGRTWQGVPVIAANMDTVGTFEMATALAAHRCVVAIHKHYTVDEWIKFAAVSPDTVPFMAVSAGTSEDDFKKLEAIITAIPAVSMICLDVANGYSEHFVNFVRRVRETYPKHTIMAGNVVTGEMVEELILSGADLVKVGIGPGSVCTTRKKAGVGYPQLSAVIECADAAHGLGGLIVADGGCTNPGDIAKAFGGGADFVMLGGMLAGHEESAGATVEINGKKFKEFYGMSSATAMQKHAGGVAEYRASEGKHVLVPCKGSVNATLLDILGGLRSACTYVGASTLKHLSKCTTFIRVTQQTNEVWAGLPPGDEQKPAQSPTLAPASTVERKATPAPLHIPLPPAATASSSSTASVAPSSEPGAATTTPAKPPVATTRAPQANDSFGTPFDPSVSLEDVRQMMSNFALDRNWPQYHTPRNLALALVGEIGELCEIFQWKGETGAQPGLPTFEEKEKTHLSEELADCLLYLTRLADRSGVDLAHAVKRKMAINAAKYPVGVSHGSAAKYTEYQVNKPASTATATATATATTATSTPTPSSTTSSTTT